MSLPEIVDALTPFFSLLSKAGPTDEQWAEYHAALGDLNPGDLDDALDDLRKTYAFKTLPLPVEIRSRANSARKARTATQMEPEPIQVEDGEPQTFTLPGVGSLTLRVLPDDHPALRRYACFDCKDTGWAEGPKTSLGNPSVTRCHCVRNNPVLVMERQRRAERANRGTT